MTVQHPKIRWNLLVWLGLCAIFAMLTFEQYEPNTFLHGDGNFYATMNRSLLEGTLDQRRFQPMSWYEKPMGWNRDLDAAWSNISLGSNGTYYPKHPILLPILSTPLFWLLGMNGLLLFNVLAMVTALWFAFAIASRFAAPPIAGITTMVLALSPLFTKQAYAYSNDVMYAALVVGAVHQWLGARFGSSGLLFGMAIFAKVSNGVFAIPLGVTLLLQRRWRPALQMAAFAALPISINLLANWRMFGHPLTTAYHRILLTREGQPALFNITEKFHRPFWDGLHSIWSDGDQGLSKQCPSVFAGVAGLPFLLRVAPAFAWMLLGSSLGFIWIYARFDYTYARFFLPSACLLIVPTAVFLDRAWKLVAVARDPIAAAAFTFGRYKSVAALLVIVILGLFAVHYSHRPLAKWTAVAAVEHAAVERGDGPNAQPCDYFNPRYMKWECASADNDTWLRWGRAIGEQCQFDGDDLYDKGQWLWLHPNPGVNKRITFSSLPRGEVELRYALSRNSHFANVALRLRSGDKLLREIKVEDIGHIHRVRVPAGERGATLTLEVPQQIFDWRQLCVDLRIL